MAERVLSVRLVALVDQYRQAMAASAKATHSVTDAAGRLQKVGDSISDIGSKLTSRVTLPIVAVGGLATKMAADFDDAFTRMSTLAGVSAQEVDGLKDSVLGLAGDTGKAPQELAEALYFLRSSGLEGAAAMDALEMSAKASAAGLGSTVQVADAVSSAMNAYAKSGLTAAEATDVLVATARAGKAEPAELAAQMGRVLPVAAELGVTFQDVGASIASLSLAGNDAATSTTQLTNLLSKILKPSQQASEALEAVGLSTGEIRTMIAERGLLATLEQLRAQLGDSGFTKFLEDQQAVLAGLALTGENVERNREIFEDLATSAGSADKAFATWAESMGAKNARAFADLQVAMIRFGEALAPVVSDVLGFIAGLAEAFADLDPWQQKAIVGFLALVAAIGPLMSATGTVIHAIGSVQKMIDNLGSALTNAAAASMNMGTSSASSAGGLSRLAASAAAAASVVGLLILAVEGFDRFRPRVDANIGEIENALLGFAEKGRLGGEAARVLGSDLDKLAGAFERANDPSVQSGLLDSLAGGFARDSHWVQDAKDRINALDDALAQLASRDPQEARRQFDAVRDALVGMGVPAEEVRSELDGYREAMASAETQSELTGEATGDLSTELEEEAAAAEAATDALKNHLDALRAQFDPLFGMIDALNTTRDAQLGLADAEAELAKAHVDHGAGSREVADAERSLTDAQHNARTSTVDLFAASMTLRDAMENQGLSAEAAAQSLINMALQAGFTEAQALEMAGALGFARDRANELGAADTTIIVGTIGLEEAIIRLGDAQRAMRAIDQARIHVGVTGYGGGRASGGPVRAGDVYTVGEKGPEFFVPDRDGRILTKAQAADSYAMAASTPFGWGGGGMNENHFHFYGPVASSSDAERWVAQAFNRAADSGLVNVRGRRL